MNDTAHADTALVIGRTARFGTVSAEVLRYAHFTPIVRLVYAVLTTYADAGRECFPTRRTIAADVGCSLSTVSAALQTLEEHGVVTRVARRGERGEQRSNTYVLTDLTSRPPFRLAGGGPSGQPEGALPAGRTHNKTTKNSTTKNSSGRPTAVSSRSVAREERHDESPKKPPLPPRCVKVGHEHEPKAGCRWCRADRLAGDVEEAS